MLVIGAGGFAKQLLDVLDQLNESSNLYFFDNQSSQLPDKLYNQFPIIKTFKDVRTYFRENSRSFCLGIGGPKNRKVLSDEFTSLGGELSSIVSPLARIGKYEVLIKPGVTILTGSIVENSVKIGRGSLVNLYCTITHDSIIGDFCEISPGVHVSGRCNIGNQCFIGTGAVLLPNVRIGDGAVVGAGAVVTSDVDPGVTVVGVPAKNTRKR